MKHFIIEPNIISSSLFLLIGIIKFDCLKQRCLTCNHQVEIISIKVRVVINKII